ncbi:MAG: hypothetical protein ABFD29_04300 [Anaerolineaceae bacterium]
MNLNDQQTIYQDKPTKSFLNKIATPNVLIGVGLVLLGVLIILNELFSLHAWRWIWPLFFLIPGIAFVLYSISDNVKQGEALSIFGSMLTTFGILFLYQSLSGHWASWAYAWALIVPTSIGAGLWFYGSRRNLPELVHSGQLLTRIGLIIFALGAAFFEILLGISHSGRITGPIFMILVGLYFLLDVVRKK